MLWIVLYVLVFAVIFLPLVISFLNRKSTIGLRVLCGSLCLLNAGLMLLLLVTNTHPAVNFALYMTFILLSLDVSLRKNVLTPEPVQDTM